MVTKICVGDYVGDIYHHVKFYPNRFRGFGSAHPSAQSDSTIFGGFFRKATAETRAPILTQNTSKDAVLRKKVPFWVMKPISKILTPIFPQNRYFGAPFRRVLELFRPKTALTLDSSRVNDP